MSAFPEIPEQPLFISFSYNDQRKKERRELLFLLFCSSSASSAVSLLQCGELLWIASDITLEKPPTPIQRR
jgi:hypothetical protein